MYDFLIIGGGPAGTAAAVYAARKKLKTALITESFGGQSIVSSDIQNWIGEPHISGIDLAKKFESHVKSFGDAVEIKSPEKVTAVKKINCEGDACDFEITTDKGNIYQTKTIFLGAGARRRRLGIPGEDKFDGKGVAFCSTCDAPLFGGRDVAVVGGGNAGLEAVMDLMPYANKLYLLERGDALKGDQVTQEEIKKNEKVQIIFNAGPKEIHGERMVTGMTYINQATREENKLDVQGVFVEIGSIPNSEIVKDIVEIDKYGQIIIDSKNGTTSQEGIYAAGDITDDPYKQNNISAGDAVKGTLTAYNHLLKRGR